ncbi:class C beta-lactamase [Duganella sp. Root1480D1]|uniref:class C beta-lactamase n=1 Tax=Duganella sp. Root1480D1 TaxID=1736471 RepID=UPI000AFD26B2|nr:class C beta-lactamase [Duganella sp. Root1480D1]
MKRKIFALLAGLGLPLLAYSAEHCLAMADAATGKWLVLEGVCDKRLPPMSTFKLPIALMGYDAGVLWNEHAPVLPFKQGYVDWRPVWRQAHDPSSWMKESVVWYSQQVTLQLGDEQFANYVKRFGYGNVDVSGDPGKDNGLSNSWLGSSLRISPDEQIGFLRRIVNRELGVKPTAYDTARTLVKWPEEVGGWQVFGKTGSGSDGGRKLGWYVGWLERGEQRVVFAQVGDANGMQVRDDFLRGLKVRAAVEGVIPSLMAEQQLPGMAVAVTLDGKPYYFNYGIASRETNAPVSENTLFEIGSVSKTLTATLGTWALVQGKLSLDAHPSRYLPQLKGSAIDKATMLHLATYTAGGLKLQFPDEVREGQEIGFFRAWRPDAAPGTMRRYSNPSIGLFGHAAAAALGIDFATAMASKIFPRLGMKNTYGNVPAHAMPDYAWGYDDGRQVRVNPGPFDAEAYGVKTSSTDLLRFVQANIDPSHLEPFMRRAVAATHVPYFEAGPLWQGLGWEQFPYPATLERLQSGSASAVTRELVAARRLTAGDTPGGATLFHKTGSTNGFGAYAAFVPQKKIGIVMLANSTYPNADRIKAAYAILQQLAP